jgi:transcription initiation factor TFIIIB Brf1 subunit/transcription initiation factor TFIIB
MEKSVCPLCNGRLICVDDELVCQSCGYVLQETLATPAVTGQKILYELGSQMDFKGLNGDGKFSGIGESSSIRYYKRLSEHWLKTSKESEEYYCMKVISRVCEKLSIPENVALYAFELSKNILSKKEGFGDISVPTVCLYTLIVSCKRAKISRISIKRLFKTFKTLGYRVSLASLAKVSCISNMAIEPKPVEEYLTTVIPAIISHPMVSERLKGHYLSPVDYERKLYRATVAVLSYVDRIRRGGHNPYAVATTAVYAGEIVLSKVEGRRPLFSQRMVSECVEVAEYTVREQYSELFKEAVYMLLANLKS